MAVIAYERFTDPSGKPGYIAVHDTGQKEYFSAEGVSLGFVDPSVAMLPPPMQPLPAQAPQQVPRLKAPPQQPPLPVPTQPSRGNDVPPAGTAITKDYFYDASTVGPPVLPQSPPFGGVGGGGANPYGGAGIAGNPYQPGGGGFSDGAAPRYADGSTHPLQGGGFRVPGGTFAQQDDGVDRRQQMNVPGGAKAGPFEISAAPLPSNRAHGGYAVDKMAYSRGGGAQSGGGGGNSLAKSLGSSLRGKIEGKLQPGLSSDQYAARQQRQYDRQGRKMDAAYGGSSSGVYQDGMYLGTGEEKMRGFSKKMDPAQAYGFYYRPSALLPTVAPGLSPQSPRYAEIAEMPASQLSTLMYGGRGKAKEGPSQYVNNLARFYGDVANDNAFYDADTLLGKLHDAKGKSLLGSQFKRQPYGTAVGNMQSMLNAIYRTSLDPTSAAVSAAYADTVLDQYGSRFAKRNPRKAPPINRWVTERL
jgi:hypothetical protein